MGNFFGKMKEKVLRLSAKMEQHQQAITFAEAGEHEHAHELVQAHKVEEKKIGIDPLLISKSCKNELTLG